MNLPLFTFMWMTLRPLELWVSGTITVETQFDDLNLCDLNAPGCLLMVSTDLVPGTL